MKIKLRELRKERRISQLKLAMDLGMNQNSISRYETGERQADYETLIAFADYFKVSIDYLLLCSTLSRRNVFDVLYLSKERQKVMYFFALLRA